MSYTKVNFTDKTTPLDAANLGILDDALADQDERIDAVSNAVINLGLVYDVDTLLNHITGGSSSASATYIMATFSASTDLRSILTRDDSSNSLRGLIIRNSRNQNDYLVYTSSTIYVGRMQDDGTITNVFKFTGTSITA